SQDIVARGDLKAITELFHEEHHRLFRHRLTDRAIEIMAQRVRVRGKLPSPSASSPSSIPYTGASHTRRMLFKGTWYDAPSFRQPTLPLGWTQPGPCVVEQDTATTIVPPGFDVVVGALGDLLIKRNS